MKQKRKVKSLIPQEKDLNWGLLTALLFTLWVALCLWAVSFMSTSSVWAARLWQDISTLSYSGIDDKVEVLYNLDFAKPEDLEKKLIKMYIKDTKNLYVQTAIPLVENPDNIVDTDKNEVADWVHSNILWWYNNEVKSDNITIVWWSDITVENGNNNAVVFWWDEINLEWEAQWNSATLVWGKKNEVNGRHNWVVIIWWEEQKVIGDNVENIALIWWSNIKLPYGNNKNIVVWWSDIVIKDWLSNVFAFGSNFVPQTSGTFYLNVEKWVWVNVKASGKKGLSTNGAVKFGEVDIDITCAGDNLGVIGTWKVDDQLSCLVGCALSSSDDGWKWEMLDRSEECAYACDHSSNGRCSDRQVEIPETAEYTGFCVYPQWMSIENASACTPDVWSSYKNVFFEASLIDSNKNCPLWAANKCIYKCDTGYHLTGDTTQTQNNIYRYQDPYKNNPKCFKDCNLVDILWSEWSDVWDHGVIKHNMTVIAYNKREVPCSYDAYSYNLATRTHGSNPSWYTWWYYLDNGYGTKWHNRGWYGKDDTKNRYKLPETCKNNAHEQTLVCVNWKMFIANKDGKTSAGKSAILWWTTWDDYLWYRHNWYIYKTCNTKDYTCNSGQYNITESYIRNVLEDTWVTTSPDDRSELNWTRWKYKLCLDYKSNGMECDMITEKKNTNPNNNVYDEHYEFLWCQNKYHQSTRPDDIEKATADGTYVCRKECTIGTYYGSETLWDWKSIILYSSVKKDCSVRTWHDVCQERTFTCWDGQIWDQNGKAINTKADQEWFIHKTCNQIWVDCSRSGYNVSAADANANRALSLYSAPCHSYRAYTSVWDKLYQTAWNSQNWFQRHNYDAIQNPCIDEGVRYKLVGCKKNCIHSNDDKKCVDEKNIGSKSYCDKNIDGQVDVGYTYKQWTSEDFHPGTMKSEWKCGDYYCIDGYYDNGSQCKANPTLSKIQESCDKKPEPERTWHKVYTITGQFDNANWFYYEVRSGSTYENSTYVSETDRCFDGCVDEDDWGQEIHRENESCVPVKKNYYNCIWTLPAHAKLTTTSHYNYGEHPAEYKYESGPCSFTCDTWYEWTDSYACADVRWKCSSCSYTVTYEVGEWAKLEKTSNYDEVPCEGRVNLPSATKQCNTFSGWYTDEEWWTKVSDPYYPTENVTLYAHWTPDYTSQECKPKCADWTGQPNWTAAPEYDEETMTKGPDPEEDGLYWNYSNNSKLEACQWKCNPWYKRDWNKCIKWTCSWWVVPPAEWVISWGSTYTWTSQRGWAYKGTWDLSVCLWRCADNRELSWSAVAGWNYECVRIVKADCGEPQKHYKCGEGTPTWTGEILVDGEVWWWKWTCEWTKEKWEDAQCIECDTKNGYKEAEDEDGNKTCIQCNHCAASGFPYCFPIDFSSTCKEGNYNN